MRRSFSTHLSLFVMLSSCCSLGCHEVEREARPNVVVLMLDTTRVDHLGAYGAQSPSPTPFLDELAARSLVFENAWAAATITAPSTASVFTGLLPTRHGVESNLLANVGRKADDLSYIEFLSSIDIVALPRSVSTLTEHFAAAGYQTLGIGANPNFCDELGFERGFDVFSEHSTRDAAAMLAEQRKLRTQLDPRRPTFTYMHFLDPHAPYERRVDFCLHPEREQCPAPCRYRSEVGFLDHHLRLLYEENGWDEDTIVLVVTDHGEEFHDHGGIMHRFSVHQELARVALILRAPGVAAGRSSRPAHHVDVLPTLLELADLKPPELLDGVSLLSQLDATAERELITCRVAHKGTQRWWGMTLGEWRLLEHEPSGKARLYHLTSDPGEQLNLAEQRPELVARLRERLERARAELKPVPFDHVQVDLSERLDRELRHLGYTGD